MQRIKKGFLTVDHKNFIQHVINNKITKAVELYIATTNEQSVCGIKEIDNEEDLSLIYEKRMVLFLHDILQDNPLKELEYMMEKWQRYELKCTHKLQPVLPEDIIKNYSALIKTLMYFLREYNNDLVIEHHIVTYFEDLQQEIEHLIFDTFKKIQKKAYQTYPNERTKS